ncbi:hypothetical protein BSK59_28920 [Paenibacillus odorifer]|uniref:hypothetical protein n=1 Tax=Paenibacillus odorifer TaxID=189426 RepID=UPI00096CC168|nr:hypothetical protein [Paenibacillus odorifer]OME46868.1 hypothetical protein BSK59_28920 [Paenibacillus odorifer]
MDFYVSGYTVDTGREILEYVEAADKRQAYRMVSDKHGQLKRGYAICIVSHLDGTEEFPEVKHSLSSPILADEEVFRIAAAVCSNDATRDEYQLFTAYFTPMVKNAIRLRWNDIDDISTEEIEVELIEAIATRFMPRVDGRGTFRDFIKINVHSELTKRWLRKKYVNGKKGKPRKELFQIYLEKQAITLEERDPVLLRAKVIETVKQLRVDNRKLSRKEKKDFYGYMILPIGMHKECLKSLPQIEAFERCYGEGAITEAECAEMLGTKQQTVHRNKRRAEDNILEYIEKFFLDSG